MSLLGVVGAEISTQHSSQAGFSIDHLLDWQSNTKMLFVRFLTPPDQLAPWRCLGQLKLYTSDLDPYTKSKFCWRHNPLNTSTNVPSNFLKSVCA